MHAADNSSEQVLERDSRGRFIRGSGNPHGRPVVVREVRSLARQYTEDAISTLVAIAGDKHAPAAARVGACCAILDRAWGRPEAALPQTGAVIDLPEEFTPASAGDVVRLYEQLVTGLVTTESAVAALARAEIAPPVEERRRTDEPGRDPPYPCTSARPDPEVGPAAQADGQGAAPGAAPPSGPATPTRSLGAGIGDGLARAPLGQAAVHPDPWVAPDPANCTHDSTGCPTAAGMLAAQRGRELAAARERAANEARCEAESRRARAAAAEREQREEEAG